MKITVHNGKTLSWWHSRLYTAWCKGFVCTHRWRLQRTLPSLGVWVTWVHPSPITTSVFTVPAAINLF